jgi:hypothetical protein
MLLRTFKPIIKVGFVALAIMTLLMPIQAYALSVSASDIYSSTNSYRASLGKSSLTRSSQLETAARNKANDMFAKQYWSHYGPDGSTPWSFIAATGYEYTAAGENLAQGASSGSQVVEAWRASPGHDENLRGDYNQVGIAVAYGTLNGVETNITVAMYALNTTTPAPAPSPDPTPEPVARAPETPTATNQAQSAPTSVLDADDPSDKTTDDGDQDKLDKAEATDSDGDLQDEQDSSDNNDAIDNIRDTRYMENNSEDDLNNRWIAFIVIALAGTTNYYMHTPNAEQRERK